MRTCVLALALVIAGLLSTGCGLTRIVIIATPERATLSPDASVEITALVTGTDQVEDKAVTWLLCNGDGEDCTSSSSTRGTLEFVRLNPDGNSVVRYTAPSSQPSSPDCTEEEDGCSLVVKAQLVDFDAACFARMKISGPPNPVPVITSLSPSTATEGGAAFTLTVLGTDFVSGSVVQWNGSDRPTTFISATELQADISASDIATLGTADVTVVNPVPGGGTSNAVTFTINATTGGAEERVSLADDGSQANGGSFDPVANTGGRFVAFKSAATNLVPNDTNGVVDIFVRDTCRGATGGCTPSTERVSVATDGTEANDSSDFGKPSISGDGRFVAFDSPASNLVSGDTNGEVDVFVRDTCRGASGGCTLSTVRVSVASDGTEANNLSSDPTLSSDGRFVIFSSVATNLTTSGTDGIFVHDRDTDTDGIFDEPGAIATVQVNASIPLVPSMSGDARFVSYGISNDDASLGDTNNRPDIVVQDTCRGVATGCTPQTVLATVATDGTQADAQSVQHTLGADGRFVVFDSDATTLVAADTNGFRDVFLRDTCLGASTGCTPITVRASVADNGSEANGNSFIARFGMYNVSPDGRLVVFASAASNLVAGDTNNATDLFIRDTCLGATGCTPTTVRISLDSGGNQHSAGVSTTGFSMSPDGIAVAFGTANALVPEDTNGVSDIYIVAIAAGSGGGGGNPVPVIDTITPDTVTAGGADFTLTVSGTGFISSSEVQVEGQARATTFIDATTLEATVLAADIAAAGTASVTVVNPGPGGGTSNNVVLSINNPAPVITSIRPDTATEGGSAFTLTVDGSGFIASSVVRWNGSDRTTTFVNDTRLTADIPDTDIATAGTTDVTVFNPAPGGGTSNAIAFTIGAPLACTPGVGTRFSVASDGTEGDDDSDHPVVSADGRYVAFDSVATNLVANDTNATTDIFVHDRDTDNDGIFDEPGAISTVRVSVASDGTEADGSSALPSMSPDGRFVAFQSAATNLVANDTNGLADVFVHDRDTDEDGIFDEPGAISTVRVSVASDGSEANDTSRVPMISADGRFTAFISPATNLVAGDTNGAWDVFVHDRDTDDDGIFDEPGAISTVRVTVASDGTEANNIFNLLPGLGSISPDGRWVTYSSQSTNLVAGDTNNTEDIFVHDRDTDEDGIFDEAGAISTVRVSLASDGTAGNFPSSNSTMSADGRFIAFESLATNLIASDANGSSGDIYVHDRDADEDGIFDEPGAISTVLVSVASDGTQGNGASDEADLSADGRFVVFRSAATNLVTNDTTTGFDIFVHDRDTDGDGIFDEPGAIETVRVSVASDGTEANLIGRSPVISADGSATVFSSDADNLVLNDNNVARDIFGGEACLLVPGGGGGGNPVPVIDTITPDTVTVGGADFTLTVSGTGFISSSEVQVDGSARATTFLSSTQLEATVLAADIAAAGTANVTVVNPGPGGGASNIAVLNINNPTPTITGITPDAATEGDAAFTLTVDGSGFISSSVVRWNNSDRTTTFVNGTQLTADIPGTDIATAGTADVTVFNPTPGGGTSAPATFTINAVGPAFPLFLSINRFGARASSFVVDSPAISAAGRYVAFSSLADDLVAGDTNPAIDVFLRDTCVGATGCTESTIRVSVSSAGGQGSNNSRHPVMTPDARFIAFDSAASELVANDTNNQLDIFVRDTCIGATGCTPSTIRASLTDAGAEATGGASQHPAISADGRFVAFDSDANNLVAGDTNSDIDVFVRDTCVGTTGGCSPTTVRVSLTSTGAQPFSASGGASISATGRFITFVTDFPMVPGDNNGTADVFLLDRDTDEDGVFDESGATQLIRVSLANDGSESNGNSVAGAVSGDGRYVAFESSATNLVVGGTSGPQIFLRDTCIGATSCTPSTILVSEAQGGGGGDGSQTERPLISANGRFVAFHSDSSDLVTGDTNGLLDVFVRDTCSGASVGCVPATHRVSLDRNGDELPDGTDDSNGIGPGLSPDGGFAGFGTFDAIALEDDSIFPDFYLAITGF